MEGKKEKSFGMKSQQQPRGGRKEREIICESKVTEWGGGKGERSRGGRNNSSDMHQHICYRSTGERRGSEGVKISSSRTFSSTGEFTNTKV